MVIKSILEILAGFGFVPNELIFIFYSEGCHNEGNNNNSPIDLLSLYQS